MPSKFFGNKKVKNTNKTGSKKAPKTKGAKSNAGVRKVGRGK